MVDKIINRPGEETLKPDHSLGDSQEEAAAYIVTMKCRRNSQKSRETTISPHLPEEHIKDLLSPESKKSRFVEFREQFSEDMFFKKPQLGKALSLQTKPDTFTNENFTYGIKPKKSENSYELIMPKKSPEEITRVYANWHDKYRISHNHHFPSERIERHYNENFNPNATFGICNQVDKTGRLVGQCLQHSLVVMKKAQKVFNDRTQVHLGMTNYRHTNLNENAYFGKKSQNDGCDVRALLQNITTCSQNLTITSTTKAIRHVHKLRRVLFNRRDFHMHDLKTLLQKYDKDSTGFITLSQVFQVLHTLRIRANEKMIRRAMSHFEILLNEGERSERVDIDLFWKMVHIQYTLPHINAAPESLGQLYQDTTYREFCRDHDKTLQHALHKPSNSDGTRAADCISPGISVHFGLNPSDFEILRSKEELRTIFYHLLGDKFDEVWEWARTNTNGDVNCKLRINAMREAMVVAYFSR